MGGLLRVVQLVGVDATSLGSIFVVAYTTAYTPRISFVYSVPTKGLRELRIG